MGVYPYQYRGKPLRLINPKIHPVQRYFTFSKEVVGVNTEIPRGLYVKMGVESGLLDLLRLTSTSSVRDAQHGDARWEEWRIENGHLDLLRLTSTSSVRDAQYETLGGRCSMGGVDIIRNWDKKKSTLSALV